MKKILTEWRKYTQKINEGHDELGMAGSTTLPFSQNDEADEDEWDEEQQFRDINAAIELMNSGEGDAYKGGKPWPELYEDGERIDLGEVEVQTHDNLPSWAIEDISKEKVKVQLLNSEDDWAYVLVLGDDGVPVMSYDIETVPLGKDTPPWADIKSWDEAVRAASHMVDPSSSN